jgi:hypothetical protein
MVSAAMGRKMTHAPYGLIEIQSPRIAANYSQRCISSVASDEVSKASMSV